MIPPGRCPHCGGAMPKWPPDRIIQAIHEWVELYGRPPYSTEWNGRNDSPIDRPTVGTVRRMFGSMGNAVRAAGYRFNQKGPKGPNVWTKRKIADAITEWRFVHGRWPTTVDWKNAAPEHPSQATVYDYFGSWPAALSAAGKLNPESKEALARAEKQERRAA